MNARVILVVAVAMLFVTVQSQRAILQSGANFPGGIILGSDAECDAGGVGAVRFNNATELMELCTSGGWVNASVAAEQLDALSAANADLESRVSHLENVSATDPNVLMYESNRLHGNIRCSSRGFTKYLASVDRLVCECYCDPTYGCWDSYVDCSRCASGWQGEQCTDDVEAPTAVLLGDDPVTVEAGAPYVDAGIETSDNRDDLLGIPVAITDETTDVDVDHIGTYYYTYSLADSAGNTVSSTRTIVVQDTTLPVVELNGDAVVTVEAGDSWVDPLVEITNNDADGYTFTPPSYGTTTVGVFTLDYTVVEDIGSTTVSRQLVIIDTTAPVLFLLGDATQTVEVHNTWVDPGADSTDNADGHVSISVAHNVDTGLLGTYTATYSGVDAEGNVADDIQRTVVVVDTTVPSVSTTGGNVNLFQFETYSESGASATDNYDGDVSPSISIDASQVDTTQVGTYTVSYSATDANGNVGSATRTVTVNNALECVVGPQAISTEQGWTPYSECPSGYEVMGLNRINLLGGNGNEPFTQINVNEFQCTDSGCRAWCLGAHCEVYTQCCRSVSSAAALTCVDGTSETGTPNTWGPTSTCPANYHPVGMDRIDLVSTNGLGNEDVNHIQCSSSGCAAWCFNTNCVYNSRCCRMEVPSYSTNALSCTAGTTETNAPSTWGPQSTCASNQLVFGMREIDVIGYGVSSGDVNDFKCHPTNGCDAWCSGNGCSYKSQCCSAA